MMMWPGIFRCQWLDGTPCDAIVFVLTADIPPRRILKSPRITPIKTAKCGTIDANSQIHAQRVAVDSPAHPKMHG